MKAFLHQALTLARVSNLPTVWTNVLAAWAINATASPTFKIMPEVLDLTFFDWWTFAYLAIGASLIYAGGWNWCHPLVGQNYKVGQHENR